MRTLAKIRKERTHKTLDACRFVARIDYYIAASLVHSFCGVWSIPENKDYFTENN